MSAPPKPSQATAFYNAEHYDPSKLVPENSVGYLMRKVMSSIRTQADAQLSLHDLTYAQWLPLFKLLKGCPDSVTAAALARDLDVDPAAITRLFDRLEAKGLVRRERSTSRSAPPSTRVTVPPWRRYASSSKAENSAQPIGDTRSTRARTCASPGTWRCFQAAIAAITTKGTAKDSA